MRRQNETSQKMHPEIDIRQYFQDTAIRDNILAIVCPFVSDWDITRILCSSKSVFDCNVSFEEAILNLDLLSGKRMKDCRKYIAGVSNQMLDQFEPWYFGVAFAFCFKYCTGMPDMQTFDKVKRHRRHENAPLVDLQLWTKIISRRCEKALSNSWGLGFCK